MKKEALLYRCLASATCGHCGGGLPVNTPEASISLSCPHCRGTNFVPKALWEMAINTMQWGQKAFQREGLSSSFPARGTARVVEHFRLEGNEEASACRQCGAANVGIKVLTRSRSVQLSCNECGLREEVAIPRHSPVPNRVLASFSEHSLPSMSSVAQNSAPMEAHAFWLILSDVEDGGDSEKEGFSFSGLFALVPGSLLVGFLAIPLLNFFPSIAARVGERFCDGTVEASPRVYSVAPGTLYWEVLVQCVSSTGSREDISNAVYVGMGLTLSASVFALGLVLLVRNRKD
jgi:predicted RNA-binding Zn-ribbon protein involved in translation (DUF1610 family)